MFVADTPEKIKLVQLLSLRGAVKLEARGIKRRGRSATAIAKQYLGLSRGTNRNKVLEGLEAEIASQKALLDAEQANVGCFDNSRPVHLNTHPHQGEGQ